MPPRNIHISEADANAAKYEMFEHPDPIVQKRMLALRMKYLGFENQVIAEVVGCSRNTIGNYLSLYEQGGRQALKQLNYHQPKSKLDKHQAKVEATFREQPPHSVREAAKRIKDLTGLKRSPGRIRAFLRRMGRKPRQTGQLPAKADPQRQRQFHDEQLQPLLEKARQGQCHVFFLDGVHFVLAAFIAILWCFERTFVKTAAGRFRLNVLGVIHATSKEFMGLYNTTYITADTVVQLLERIAKKFSGLPIYIFLDNARYQRCKLVPHTAAELGIQLVFLPPYSPNTSYLSMPSFVSTAGSPTPLNQKIMCMFVHIICVK